jgi:hypothetical protein
LQIAEESAAGKDNLDSEICNLKSTISNQSKPLTFRRFQSTLAGGGGVDFRFQI